MALNKSSGNSAQSPESGIIRRRTLDELSPEERKKAEKLLAIIAKQEAIIAQAKASDPFWYYEPSDGSITEDGMKLMLEYLKEDDVPSGALDCQIDVHTSTANIILAAGGNQVGKTTLGAIEAFIAATGSLPFALKDKYPEERLPKKRPCHVRVVGVDHQTFLRNLLPTYQYWAPKQHLKAGKWSESYSSEGRVLTLYDTPKGGEVVGTIEFMTNAQDVESFQGPPRHKVIYDESPRYEIYKENLMRFTTADRVDIMFCMTPTQGMNWVKDEILDKVDVDGNSIAAFKIPSITNKKASIPVLREVLNGLGSYDEIKMRLLGEFVSLTGLVYGNLFNRKIHVVKPFFENLTPSEKSNYLCLSGWDLHLVTEQAGVFLLVDKQGNHYVDRCLFEKLDTEELKASFHRIVKENGYRMGWSVVDKSSNSSLIAYGGLNMYREVSMGRNAIPALRTSEKFMGSIKAGVDEMKQRLKPNKDGKPTLFVVERPENELLVQAFLNMERDRYANEDKNGPKDRIKEGKYHLHAALRYIYQFPINWYEHNLRAPEPVYMDPEVLW